ncbi:MAG: hypothetical protein JJ960_18550 [Kordiimonadaceae bacterium]|nr:hypothetical protein [Kordiimonadaceae bacterium]
MSQFDDKIQGIRKRKDESESALKHQTTVENDARIRAIAKLKEAIADAHYFATYPRLKITSDTDRLVIRFRRPVLARRKDKDPWNRSRIDGNEVYLPNDIITEIEWNSQDHYNIYRMSGSGENSTFVYLLKTTTVDEVLDYIAEILEQSDCHAYRSRERQLESEKELRNKATFSLISTLVVVILFILFFIALVK